MNRLLHGMTIFVVSRNHIPLNSIIWNNHLEIWTHAEIIYRHAAIKLSDLTAFAPFSSKVGTLEWMDLSKRSLTDGASKGRVALSCE